MVRGGLRLGLRVSGLGVPGFKTLLSEPCGLTGALDPWRVAIAVPKLLVTSRERNTK